MPGFAIQGLGGGGGVGRSGGLSGRREYYYNYFWEIENLFETKNFTKYEELISLKEMTLPSFSVNKDTYIGASLEYKFAKSVTWEDVKVTWYDSKRLLSHVKEWRKAVWTAEGGLQMPGEYKKESILHTFLPTGKSENTWTLYNSWPSQIRYGDLTYTSSDVKLVEVTITYDWAEEGVDLGLLLI